MHDRGRSAGKYDPITAEGAAPHGNGARALGLHMWVMLSVGGVTCAVLYATRRKANHSAWVDVTLHQLHCNAVHGTESLADQADVSALTFNVEEFIEPCMRAVRDWQPPAGASRSVKSFAASNPDMLDGAFVKRNGSARLAWQACKHMSTKAWHESIAVVRNVIAERQADVVLLQEMGLGAVSLAVPEGYSVAVVASSGEPGWKDIHLANVVLARDTFRVLMPITIDITLDAPVPRSAACAHLQGFGSTPLDFFACSVHLLGGRFDDETWHRHVDLRSKQVGLIMEVMQAATRHRMPHLPAGQVPLLLGGDFNAMLSPAVARPKLATHPVFLRTVGTPDELRFLNYATSGHAFLRDHGFRPAYLPGNVDAASLGAVDAPTPRVEKTSVYGSVVDWLYFPDCLGDVQPRAPVVLDTIANGVSDHHAVHAYLRMPITEIAPSVMMARLQHSVNEGIGTAFPAMVINWLLYAVQVQQVRAATQSHADAQLGRCVELFAACSADHPGRSMSTIAVGLSTFTFWFAAYFCDVENMRWGTVFASVLTVVLFAPWWTVVARLQADVSKTNMQWTGQIFQIWSERGAGGFYAGLGPDLLLISFPLVQGHLYMTTVNIIVWVLGAEDDVALHNRYAFLAPVLGSVATLVATVATYPLQFVRVRWQNGLSSCPGADEAQDLGPAGVVCMFYRGLMQKLVHATATASLVFLFKERYLSWVVEG